MHFIQIFFVNSFHLDILNFKKFYYLILLFIIGVVLNYLNQTIFFGETIFYNTYADKLTADRIEKMYNNGKSWQWLSYLLIPLVLFLKVLYNSFWLTSASIFNDSKVKFLDNYNICLKAEYVFIIMGIFKFLWLVLFKEVNTLTDLSFMPGSLSNLFKTNEVPVWLNYPLQVVNIWEVLFCIIGTSMCSIQFNISTAKAAKLFCIPYLMGLFIWLMVVVFLSLQFS